MYTITIGSDPELQLASLDKASGTYTAYEAHNFIVDPHNTEQLGLDGNPRTMELRPEPATDPLKHAENIEHILKTTNRQAKYRKVYSKLLLPSTDFSSIGGHIHIGSDYFNDTGTSGEAEKRTKMRIRIARAMDEYVAFPLLYVENPNHAKYRRSYSRYGSLSDVREKSYGLEYRTTPCFLASKKLTEATLCLAYTVANEVINYSLVSSFEKLQGFGTSFMQHYTELLKPYLDIIHTSTEKLHLYSQYKEQIAYLYDNINKNNILIDRDIHAGWGLKKYREVILNKTDYHKTLVRLIRGLNINGSIEHSYITCNTKPLLRPIALSVLVALNKLPYLYESSNINTVKLDAINYSYGDTIVISSRLISNQRKQEQLKKLIQGLITLFHYPKQVSVQIDTSYRYSECDRISFGRRIREHNRYLPEAITLVFILAINRSWYYSVKRKTIPSILKCFTKLATKKKPIDPSQIYQPHEVTGVMDIDEV